MEARGDGGRFFVYIEETEGDASHEDSGLCKENDHMRR